MSLATAQTPPRHSYFTRGCSFGRWLATLPHEERAAVEGWLLPDSDWSHTAIATRINDDPDYPGVRFRAEQVAYHRSGECTCAR